VRASLGIHYNKNSEDTGKGVGGVGMSEERGVPCVSMRRYAHVDDGETKGEPGDGQQETEVEENSHKSALYKFTTYNDNSADF